MKGLPIDLAWAIQFASSTQTHRQNGPDQWQARFDSVSEWVCRELENTNPELATALWEFLSRVETELDPHQIIDVARWLRDVLEGTALLLADGLSPWDLTPSASVT